MLRHMTIDNYDVGCLLRASVMTLQCTVVLREDNKSRGTWQSRKAVACRNLLHLPCSTSSGTLRGCPQAPAKKGTLKFLVPVQDILDFQLLQPLGQYFQVLNLLVMVIHAFEYWALHIHTGTFVTGQEARKAPLASSLIGELDEKDPWRPPAATPPT